MNPNSLLSIAPRVLYITSPVCMFDTLPYACLAAQVRGSFPHATILHARDAFHVPSDWHMVWPAIRTRLSGMVFITDTTGQIDNRTYAEIMEVRRDRRPVWLLSTDQQLVPLARIAFHYGDDEPIRVTVRPALLPVLVPMNGRG